MRSIIQILLILFLLCLLGIILLLNPDYIFYYEHFWKPYKKVLNKKIKHVMVGLPTIDRDSDIADKMYNALIISINELKKKYNIIVDLVVITRESDKKIINFWKDKVHKIVLVSNYTIKSRHNFEKISEKFNKLADIAKKYDALFIVESDIIIKPNTSTLLYEKLNTYHIATTYHEIPWCKYPIIMTGGLIPLKKNARDINEDTTILGHGTGAIMIRSEVLNECKFNNKNIFGINGQDIGFYISAFINRYKICLINQEVEHLYNRII